MDQSPEALLRRLELLRCWQSEQQQKLQSKQLSHSELCSMEQRKLCEIFGLSITSTVSNVSLTDDCERQANECDAILKDLSEMDTNDVRATFPKKLPVEMPINNFSLEELESYGMANKIEPNHDIADKPKQSFLKRGQGLAARFKIHPEKLRIDNLPKYKFTNAHKNSKFHNRISDVKRVETTNPQQLSGELKLTKTNSINQGRNVVLTEQDALKNAVKLPISTKEAGEFYSIICYKQMKRITIPCIAVAESFVCCVLEQTIFHFNFLLTIFSEFTS